MTDLYEDPAALDHDLRQCVDVMVNTWLGLGVPAAQTLDALAVIAADGNGWR
jgi:hypothetical protein